MQIRFKSCMRSKDQQKEQRILQTALLQIARHGIAGLRMQQLAKESAIATGTVYLYFPDKASLLQALYRMIALKMQKTIWGGHSEARSLETRLRQRWYNYLRYVQSFPLEMIFLEQYHRSPYFVETEESANTQTLQPLIELLREGIQTGQLKNCPASLHLAFLCGAVQEIVAWSANNELPPMADITHQVWEMTWDGLKKS